MYRLSEKENIPVDEIARRLSVTEETVRRRLAWANAFIRKEANKFYFEGVETLLLLLYAKEFLKYYFLL
jgi:hypothetical protein